MIKKKKHFWACYPYLGVLNWSPSSCYSEDF